jgi:prepilin-type N-terminal cleavage/methylation domain-containing protein
MPTLAPSSKRTAGFTHSWRSAVNGFTHSWRSAQKGFTRSWRYAQQGFTLIEMLVVLTVLGLVAAVAAQRIGRRPESVLRHDAQARLQAAIQTARRESGRTGAVRAVDPAAIVEGAALTAVLPGGARPGLILVYPDGSSNGGLITAKGRPLATLDWLTAQVRDAR